MCCGTRVELKDNLLESVFFSTIEPEDQTQVNRLTCKYIEPLASIKRY